MLSTSVARTCLYYSLGFFFRDYCLGFVRFGDKSNLQSLQKKVNELSKKMGAGVPITVSANPFIPWAAHGCQCYGKAGITVPHPENLQHSKKSEELQTAILAHEISHIKHNDGMWILIIPIITALVATFFLAMFVSIVVADVMGTLAGIVAFIVRNHFQEAAADAEACKYLNDGEKLAMMDYFETLARKQRVYRNQKGSFLSTIFRKILCDSQGNSVSSYLTHPSYQSRIEMIRASITAPIKPRKSPAFAQ